MPPVKAMKLKVLIVAVVLSVGAFGFLVYRLFTLQITGAQVYQERAQAQQMRSSDITANRGTIYDANGNILAKSATVWTVILEPALIPYDKATGQSEDLEIMVKKLPDILGIDEQKIRDAAAKRGSYYEIIARRVEQDTRDKLLAFTSEYKINCISIQEDSRRYYPYGNFAAQVLGFVGNENQGAYGLESYYNNVLSGTPGRVLSAKNGWGTDMDFRQNEKFAATNGSSLVLTLDETIQHILEKNLETALVEHDIQNRACAIAMNPKTGAILGMATKPDFDPNEPLLLGNPKEAAEAEALKGSEEAYKAYKQEKQWVQWRSKCISETYDPGSVFKLCTAAMALETGAQTLQNSYYCPGYYMVGSQKYGCWKDEGHGMQDFTKAVQNSCNPAFIMIGQAVGGQNFYDYYGNFGFTKISGVDLPGEESGLGHTLEELRGDTGGGTYLASSSFGQTFQITPLQMAAAVCATVNGGVLYQPYIVERVLDADGSVVSTTEPAAKHQVISAETSATIRQLAEAVVADGSGRSSQVPGYRIGGKTGTSQKINKGKNIITGEYDYILSFVGIAPADDPELVVLVMLDEPAKNGGFGSTIAAPVVGAILEEALPYLGIDPQFTEEEMANRDVEVPYLEEKAPHDAQSTLRQLGLETKVMGSGALVLKQIPSVAATIPKGGTVVIYTDEESMTAVVEVPDVFGQTAQTANKQIYSAGLNMKVDGADISMPGTLAASQYPAAGTQVPPGTIVEVVFKDTKLAG